jgi:hypothetical protein
VSFAFSQIFSFGSEWQPHKLSVFRRNALSYNGKLAGPNPWPSEAGQRNEKDKMGNIWSGQHCT